MTAVYTDGKLFNDYTDFVIKFDLSDLSAAKVEFSATYGGKTYYPFNGNTRIDSYTYNTQPINFDPGERYMAMAGANATDSGVAILKFNTQYVPPAPASNKDFSTVISGATGVFDYNSIGDLTVSLPLSEQITSYDGYLNDHLSDWKDENNNPVNIGDAIVINGETFNTSTGEFSRIATFSPLQAVAGQDYTTLIIVIATVATMLAVGGAFIFIKRRRG